MPNHEPFQRAGQGRGGRNDAEVARKRAFALSYRHVRSLVYKSIARIKPILSE